MAVLRGRQPATPSRMRLLSGLEDEILKLDDPEILSEDEDSCRPTSIARLAEALHPIPVSSASSSSNHSAT